MTETFEDLCNSEQSLRVTDFGENESQERILTPKRVNKRVTDFGEKFKLTNDFYTRKELKSSRFWRKLQPLKDFLIQNVELKVTTLNTGSIFQQVTCLQELQLMNNTVYTPKNLNRVIKLPFFSKGELWVY